MGYTTYFTGEFGLDKPLTSAHRDYLEKFSNTRRMKRDADKALTIPDPLREAVGLPIGVDGGYFVGSTAPSGQDFNGSSVIDGNRPPSDQPGLWCQWMPNEDGTAIVWDEGEKFSDYVEWIDYLIDNFLKPWGYTLNGEVQWQGEDSADMGKIIVKNNVVKTQHAKITFEDD